MVKKIINIVTITVFQGIYEIVTQKYSYPGLLTPAGSQGNPQTSAGYSLPIAFKPPWIDHHFQMSLLPPTALLASARHIPIGPGPWFAQRMTARDGQAPDWHLSRPKKRYACKYCNREFTKNYNLMIHERVHAEEKSFLCDICGRAFRTQDRLRIHKYTHGKEKPFVCDVCGEGYRQPWALARHRTQHSTELLEEKQPPIMHVTPMENAYLRNEVNNGLQSLGSNMPSGSVTNHSILKNKPKKKMGFSIKDLIG